MSQSTPHAPVTKAIFPVGGLGTRFLPATKAMPKEMLPVVDKPLIQYAVEEAQAAGIANQIFVTGRGKTTIEDHFDYSYELSHTLETKHKTDLLEMIRPLLPTPGQVAYTRQQIPMGLGHAVWCARELVGNQNAVAVLLADDLVMADTPCLKQMMQVYSHVGGNIVAVMEVPLEHTSRYGIIDPGVQDGRLIEVKGLVEKPRSNPPSRYAIIGRYILQPEIFEALDAQTKGTDGEIQLTDAMATLLGKQPFHAFLFDGKRFDCGNKIGFLEANVAFALNRQDLAADFREVLTRYISA
ncbi:MAG: UTP--glucose-1-phosphate uridylyltransferase GalU [Holosporaceae bacterium]|jgi:UTP--glucose-1-phosphate uridylyltransferase|nr:UTP--glucose-1-phosphate uridylyltransferase GalU [Rhodospirillaceae bacterium]